MDKLEMMLKELGRYSWDDVREYDYIEDYELQEFDLVELEDEEELEG